MKEIVKRRMSMAKRIISKKVMPSKRYSMPIINEETILFDSINNGYFIFGFQIDFIHFETKFD